MTPMTPQIVKIEFAEVEIEIVIKQKSPSISTQQNHPSTYSSTMLANRTNRTANRMHPYRKPTEQNGNDTYSSAPPMPPQLNAMYMRNDQSVNITDNPQPQFQGSFSSSYDNLRD